MEIQPTHSSNQVVNGTDTDQVTYKNSRRKVDETKSSLVSLSQHSQEDFTSIVWDIFTWPYQMVLMLWDWLFGTKKEDELLGGKKKCTATSCHGDHGSCNGGGHASGGGGGGGFSRTKSVAHDSSFVRTSKTRSDSSNGVKGQLVRRVSDIDPSLHQQPIDPEKDLRALLKQRGVTEEEFSHVLANVNKTFAEVAQAYFIDREGSSLAYITWVIQNIEAERLRTVQQPEEDLEPQSIADLKDEEEDEVLLMQKRNSAAQHALRVYLQEQNIEEASFTRLLRGSTFADVAMAWYTKKAEGVRVVQGIVLQIREQVAKFEQQAKTALRAYLQEQSIEEASFTRLLQDYTFAEVAIEWHAKIAEGEAAVQNVILQIRGQAAKFVQQAEEGLRKFLAGEEIDEEEFTARLEAIPFSEIAVCWFSKDKDTIGRVAAIIADLKEEKLKIDLDSYLAERGIRMDEFLEFLAKEGKVRREEQVREQWDNERKRPSLIAKINKLKSQYQRFVEQRLNSHVLSQGLSHEMFKKALQEDDRDYEELAANFSKRRGDAEEYVTGKIDKMKQKKKPVATEATL